MCKVTDTFTAFGFEVLNVSHNFKRPVVEVLSIPRNLRIKNSIPTTIEVSNGQTRTLRSGLWMGCHVVVIQSTQIH